MTGDLVHLCRTRSGRLVHYTTNGLRTLCGSRVHSARCPLADAGSVPAPCQRCEGRVREARRDALTEAWL